MRRRARHASLQQALAALALAALAGDERVYSAERVGLLTLVCVVATFGIHSFVDWTWYVPGVACAALLCAGWLAGRGPLSSPFGAL